MNPLSKLAASASRLARGDFSARAEVVRKDEVSMVARTFNDMAERVEQYAGALEESKAELEQRVEERTKQVQQLAVVRGQLLERLISAQEEERRRVARELHDEAGQSLTVLMTGISKAIDALPEGATEANEELSRSHGLAAQTLAELRKLIYDLRPEVLDQLGLVPALRSYIKRRLDTEKIKLQLNFSGVRERLSPQVETTLFRIIQEAVTNIVRHAEASVVKIEVAAKNSMVMAIIEDNGKGFDVEAAFESPESWGLRGMRERVTIVGGELSIKSRAGGGTRLKLQIPLENV
jgi:signal transduction histidine kinase